MYFEPRYTMTTYLQSNDANYSLSTSVLLKACSKSKIDIETIQALLENSEETPNVNAFLRGESLLYRAVRLTHVQLVALLLEYGADPNQCGKSSMTPLLNAVQRAGVEGCSLKIYPAIGYEIVTLLLKQGADPSQDDGKDTPLSCAIRFNAVEIVELLLEKGADISKVVGHEKYSPLHYAIWGNNEYLFDALLKREPDLNLKDKDQKTPLMIAVSEYIRHLTYRNPIQKRKYFKFLGKLIWEGADTDITPLECVPWVEQIAKIKEIIKYLLEIKQEMKDIQIGFLNDSQTEKGTRRPRLPQELVDKVWRSKEEFEFAVEHVSERYDTSNMLCVRKDYRARR